MHDAQIKAADAALQKRIEDCVAILREHSDAVQILVSWQGQGFTRWYYGGTGNFFARQGMARDFLLERQSSSIGYEVASHLAASEGEG